MRKVTTTLITVSCFFLAACGGTGSQDSQGGEAEANSSLEVPEVDRSKYSHIHAVFDEQKQIVETPLSKYVHSEDEVTQIVSANFFAFKKCVNDLGFQTSHHTYQTEYRPNIPFAVWSQPFAEKYGYKINPVQGKIYINEGDSADNPSRDQAQTECLEQTQSSEIPVIMSGVSARPVGDMVILSEVSNQVSYLLAEDADVKAAIQEWVTCLEGNDIQIDTNYEQPIPITPDGQEESIKHALIDVQCKKDVRLMERYFDAQAQYEQALIERNQTAFNTLAEKKESSLEEARRILALNGVSL